MNSDRILVVDDEPAIGEIVQMLLTEILGLDVTLAGDGKSALELARRLHPPLVLLDIDLPGLSGLEVARRLKADAATSAIPLVAMTARPWYDVAEAGFDGYVGKPFDPDRLLAEVEKLLERRVGGELLAAA